MFNIEILTLIKNVNEAQNDQERAEALKGLENKLPSGRSFISMFDYMGDPEKNMDDCRDLMLAILSGANLKGIDPNLHSRLIFKMQHLQEIYQKSFWRFQKQEKNLQPKQLKTLRQRKAEMAVLKAGYDFIKSHAKNEEVEQEKRQGDINKEANSILRHLSRESPATNMQQIGRLEFAAMALRKMNGLVANKQEAKKFVRQLRADRKVVDHLSLATEQQLKEAAKIKDPIARANAIEDVEFNSRKAIQNGIPEIKESNKKYLRRQLGVLQSLHVDTDYGSKAYKMLSEVANEVETNGRSQEVINNPLPIVQNSIDLGQIKKESDALNAKILNNERLQNWQLELERVEGDLKKKNELGESLTGEDIVYAVINKLPRKEDPIKEFYQLKLDEDVDQDRLKSEHNKALINALDLLEHGIMLKEGKFDEKLLFSHVTKDTMKTIHYLESRSADIRNSSAKSQQGYTEQDAIRSALQLFDLQERIALESSGNHSRAILNLNQQPKMQKFYAEAIAVIKECIPADSSAKILQLKFVRDTIKQLDKQYDTQLRVLEGDVRYHAKTKEEVVIKEVDLDLFYERWTEDCKFIKSVTQKANQDELSTKLNAVGVDGTVLQVLDGKDDQTNVELNNQNRIVNRARMVRRLGLQPEEVLSALTKSTKAMQTNTTTVENRRSEPFPETEAKQMVAKISTEMTNLAIEEKKEQEQEEESRIRFHNWRKKANDLLTELNHNQADTLDATTLTKQYSTIRSQIPVDEFLEEEADNYSQLPFNSKEEENARREVCQFSRDYVIQLHTLLQKNIQGSEQERKELYRVGNNSLYKLSDLLSSYQSAGNPTGIEPNYLTFDQETGLAAMQAHCEYNALLRIIDLEKANIRDMQNHVDPHSNETAAIIWNTREQMIKAFQENFPADTVQKQFMLKFITSNVNEFEMRFCNATEQQAQNLRNTWEAFYSLFQGMSKLAEPEILAKEYHGITRICEYPDRSYKMLNDGKYWFQNLDVKEKPRAQKLFMDFENKMEEIRRDNPRAAEMELDALKKTKQEEQDRIAERLKAEKAEMENNNVANEPSRTTKATTINYEQHDDEKKRNNKGFVDRLCSIFNNKSKVRKR